MIPPFTRREDLFLRSYVAALVGTASTSFDPPSLIALRAETIAWEALARLEPVLESLRDHQLKPIPEVRRKAGA